MSECEHLQKCVFFNNSTVHKLTGLVEELQSSYCRGDYTKCARYSIAKSVGKSAVPELLLPNQHAWAKQIIEDTKKP